MLQQCCNAVLREKSSLWIVSCNITLQSRQVKRTPQDSINELIIWKMNPLVVPETSVKFTRTSLYLVRLKIFEWIKLHLHQIQRNWAGRNVVISCEFTAHYACKNEEINLKSTFTNEFNFLIINSLKESWGYAGLTWLDCKAVAPSVSHTMPRRVYRPKFHISGLRMHR